MKNAFYLILRALWAILLTHDTHIGIFLDHFQYFKKSHVCSRAQGRCDAFLVFDREALLYSLSKPATNRNHELTVTLEIPRKKCVGKFHFNKAAS